MLVDFKRVAHKKEHIKYSRYLRGASEIEKVNIKVSLTLGKMGFTCITHRKCPYYIEHVPNSSAFRISICYIALSHRLDFVLYRKLVPSTIFIFYDLIASCYSKEKWQWRLDCSFCFESYRFDNFRGLGKAIVSEYFLGEEKMGREP